MATAFPFASRLAVGRPPAELMFELAAQPLLPVPSDPPIYLNPKSRAALFRADDKAILRFFEAGDFRIQKDKVEAFLEGARLDLAELRFLGPVLSYWFELQGLPTLHASAVAMGGSGLAFLSRHGGGKTGLAAAMVQAGCPLLTDDLLVVEEKGDGWEVRPAYPEMRMWPDEAAHFAGPVEDLPLVQADSEKRRVAIGPGGFGSFQEGPVPLSRIFVASRRPEAGGEIEIVPLSRSEALIELVRHSFSPRLMEAAGLQSGRLDRLARLVRTVPVHRLVYPSGFDRLPVVVASILNRL